MRRGSDGSFQEQNRIHRDRTVNRDGHGEQEWTESRREWWVTIGVEEGEGRVVGEKALSRPLFGSC